MVAPLLTVIVPVYNVEKYIRKCVDSIINQKYPSLEIILVDDGSTDLSGKICDEYTFADNRVNTFHIKNSGTAIARNMGLNNSHGEFITFVDSDDWLSEDTYSTAMANMENIDLLRFGINVESENDDTRFGIKNYLNINETGIININYSTILNTEITVWNKIFKRKIIEENKIIFPPGVRFEDSAFTMLYLMYAKTMKSIEKQYYHYLIRDDSVMGKYHIYNKSRETAPTYLALFTHIYDNMPITEKTNLEFVGALFIRYINTASSFVPIEEKNDVIKCALSIAKKKNIDSMLIDFIRNTKIKTLIKLSLRNLIDYVRYGNIYIYYYYQKTIIKYWMEYH